MLEFVMWKIFKRTREIGIEECGFKVTVTWKILVGERKLEAITTK